MRIGFSCNPIDGGKSGVGRYIISLVHALLQVDRKNHYDLYLPKEDAHFFSEGKGDVQLHTYPSWVKQPLANIFWHNLLLPSLPDIVHIPTIRRIPLIKKTKIVATVHDMAPFVLKRKYDPLRNFYHKGILKRAIHRCDHLITVSQSTKEDIIQFTGYPERKISVIYPGIEPNVFHPIQTEKRPFFLYVSRLEHPGKNHLRLIQAFQKYKEKTGSVHQLLLAGAFWSGYQHILNYIKDNNLERDVRLLSFCPLEELVRLYNQCELMIFPSLYEGFGFPILEAMACGAPVACSNRSSLPEVSGGHATLFDPYNIEEMAAAMENPRKEGREQRIAYAKSFDWLKVAGKVVEVYEQLAG